MQDHRDHDRLYSASDLVAFLGCQHRTSLDLRALDGWEEKRVESDEASTLVQEYGDRHEHAYLDLLKAEGRHVVEIDKTGTLAGQLRSTREAMAAGAEVIFQAALLQPPFLGYADFLMRVDGSSRLGDHHYEVADTKLAKSNRAKFLVQLCLYAELLAEEQGRLPTHLRVVLGRLTDDERAARGLPAGADNIVTLRTEDFVHSFRAVQASFLKFVDARHTTHPMPVPACGQCGWRAHCDAEWERTDHLSRVANIRRDQIAKMETAGVTTMTQLAVLDHPVARMGQPVLARLKRQADLQRRPRDAQDRLRFEFLPARGDDKPAGFELLPLPNAGDLYFDMEGFPHEPGGLEYLFGVGYLADGATSRLEFKPFWAHDRTQEKKAFEDFMDFVEDRLRRFPDAHIYHYAPYERTRIKHLSSIHSTRTELRDRLLRESRLVDLYRVVSSGLLLAVPSYSIKKVEAYYGRARQGAVANAGDSIVQYEAYRVAQGEEAKARLLGEIEAYNREDVESTRLLHRWLEEIRPRDARRLEKKKPGPDAEPSPANEREAREQAARQSLALWVASRPPEDQARASNIAELLGQLLGFYWRCKLPSLWRIFERMESEPEDLLVDQDCLAMMELTGVRTTEKKSVRYECRVPPQDSKLYSGASVTCLTDELPASNFVYDEEAGVASFTRASTKPPPPSVLTVCAKDDIDPAPKLDAIYRFVQRLCDDGLERSAVVGMLCRQAPTIDGRRAGEPIVDEATLPTVFDAVSRLTHSHLVIQGPPGAGKTTIASQIIARLLAAGKSVAITSNSHAAINHLLKAACLRGVEHGATFVAAVVKRDEGLPKQVRVLESDDVDSSRHRLVGGTSWLFCRREQRQRWDYLFVDEASQVSLADVVAAGPCARNIVLLGDQMQLPQPTQGVHPGDSGLSVLEFLMQGHATVPPDQGVFLAQTFRMHPDVCRPVSEGVYEGRLRSAPQCSAQRLLLGADADPALRPVGVAWVAVDHELRSQASDEEVERIKALYGSLLRQQWIDRDQVTHRIGHKDILVLAPYNAQVRALRKALGAEARVGTVDKFQGQEAAVVICSMTSSDAESMPRGLDFLMSTNRLNVAVSRAQCLAVLVASPRLKTATCSAVEDMKLLNFFCRLAAAGTSADAPPTAGAGVTAEVAQDQGGGPDAN